MTLDNFQTLSEKNWKTIASKNAYIKLAFRNPIKDTKSINVNKM